MDGTRFDELARRLAGNASRRSLLKRTAMVAAALAGAGAASGADAARRPAPTPISVRCPGRQTPCDSGCCCPGGTTQCGAECCSSTAQCCDGACCEGTCYGEERCCPAGQHVCDGVCLQPGQCCYDWQCGGNAWRCGVDEPHVCSCHPEPPEQVCEQLGWNCGSYQDECGAMQHCGSCPEPQVCGVGDQINTCTCPDNRILCDGVCLQPGQCCYNWQCGGDAWTCGESEPHVCTCHAEPPSQVCARLGWNCGSYQDECGAMQQCGACTAPQVCGTGDEINTCVCPSGGLLCGGVCLQPGQCCDRNDCLNNFDCIDHECSCTPSNPCVENGYECGAFYDGCSSTVPCGECAAPQTCGGGGQTGKCG